MAQYRDCIVTFFDILGYSELVLSGRDPDEVLSVLAETKHHADIDPELQAIFESSFVNFSDCVVRVIPIDSEVNQSIQVGLLFHEILGLVHVQMELTARGIPIRGGVTAGPLYHGDGHLFGPSLVTAYKLESKIAQHPRIVVDPALLRRFDEDRRLGASHHTREQDREYLYSLLRQDTDGVWFVDYLRGAKEEADDPPCGYFEFLARHKQFIEAAVARLPHELGPVALKYGWLIRYHNEVVGEIDPGQLLRICGIKVADLLIEESAIPWLVPRI